MSTLSSKQPVVIVGAGMAGLSCALHLARAGIAVRVLEASDAVGGRVRTDLVKGFRLDRGFQVYLDAYPETGKLLNLDALDLKRFEPGARIYKNRKMYRLMDVFRRPRSAMTSLLAPIGSLGDKLRVGWMRTAILNSSLDQIARRPDQSTEDYLRGRGFSDDILDSFFRSFYGGIFLERELRTSSRMFEFTFKMFGLGSATLPAKGMGQIPQQLAAQLPADAVSLNSPVREVDAGGVTLASGEHLEARAVVIATDASAANALLPGAQSGSAIWRTVTNLYFAAQKSPLKEPIICLNGEGRGLVNNVCALTDAAPDYSSDGRALISVSLLGLPEDDELPLRVTDELRNWFGQEVDRWEHLRTDRISKALPEQLPNSSTEKAFVEHDGIYICGDHCFTASIEGAVVSGKRLASRLIQKVSHATES